MRLRITPHHSVGVVSVSMFQEVSSGSVVVDGSISGGMLGRWLLRSLTGVGSAGDSSVPGGESAIGSCTGGDICGVGLGLRLGFASQLPASRTERAYIFLVISDSYGFIVSLMSFKGIGTAYVLIIGVDVGVLSICRECVHINILSTYLKCFHPNKWFHSKIGFPFSEYIFANDNLDIFLGVSSFFATANRKFCCISILLKSEPM